MLRGLFFLVVILGLGLFALAVWHEVETVMLERDHPRPGALINVGTHRLHMHRHGAGTLPIVIEADMGGASYDWDGVADQLGKVTLTLTYDRAGQGWSESGPSPRSSEVVVEELRKMLDQAKIPRPMILVGHGWGGLNARLYASKYPDEVAGLVLVDALNTDGLKEDAAIGKVPWYARWGHPTAGLGLARLVFPFVVREPAGNRAALERRRGMLARTRTLQALCEERMGMTNWLAVRASMVPLGQKPVLVVARREFPGGGAEATDPRLRGEAQWQRDQIALQDITSQPRWVSAHSMSHDLQYHDVDLLVAEIRQMHELLERRSVPAPGVAPAGR